MHHVLPRIVRVSIILSEEKIWHRDTFAMSGVSVSYLREIAEGSAKHLTRVLENGCLSSFCVGYVPFSAIYERALYSLTNAGSGSNPSPGPIGTVISPLRTCTFSP